MAKQVYADNVDANGKVYKTVGENIRHGAREDVNTLLKRIENDETDIETLYEQGNTLASSIQTVSDNLDSYKSSMESEFSTNEITLYNGFGYGYDILSESSPHYRLILNTTIVQDKLITDLIILVKQIGTITYGFLTLDNASDESSDFSNVIPFYQNTINFDSTGLKQITLANTIHVPKNGYFFIGSESDSGGIAYKR